MAVPEPIEVAPWYLRNITQALELDSVTGQVHVRSSIVGGNVTISGNVIVSNVTVDAIGNIDVSGPTMPVSGNINIDAGNVTVLQGTDPWMVDGNIVVTNTVDANITGGNVTVQQGTDPWNVTGNVTISGTPTVSLGTDSQDAFGRLRVSNPTTLFDTQNRYYNHQLFASNVVGGGSYTYNSNSSTFNMVVTGANNDSVIAETYRVFPYQPGKSLLIYSTFCMNTPKSNLRQRVGYFSSQNGIFFETNGTTYNMVIRSYSSGVVTEDRIPQSSWNGDRMNGAGGATNPSGLTLYPDRTQIFFCDIEWLGVGNVRVGFVVNGQYVNCHTFQHANQVGNTTTYMSTACLPLRYEITNIGATSGGSTMTQICSTVISEGGYGYTGQPRSIGHTIATPVRLPNDQSFKPLISIRLKSTMPDAIVVPKFYTVAPVAQSNFKYIVYTRAISTGGSWVDVADSAVQYNLAPAAVSSGLIVAENFIISSNQTSSSPSQVPFGFDLQLQREPFTNVMYEFLITACTTGTNQDVYAAIEWQEVS